MLVPTLLKMKAPAPKPISVSPLIRPFSGTTSSPPASAWNTRGPCQSRPGRERHKQEEALEGAEKHAEDRARSRGSWSRAGLPSCSAVRQWAARPAPEGKGHHLDRVRGDPWMGKAIKEEETAGAYARKLPQQYIVPKMKCARKPPATTSDPRTRSPPSLSSFTSLGGGLRQMCTGGNHAVRWQRVERGASMQSWTTTASLQQWRRVCSMAASLWRRRRRDKLAWAQR